MTPPLVTLVLPYLERGGTERHVAHLVEALAGRYEFLLVSPDGPGRTFFPPDLPHLIFPRLEKTPLLGLGELRRIFRRVKEMARSRRALIHVHAAPELLAITKGIYPDLPHLLTVHGFSGSGRELAYRFAAQTGNFLAEKILCVSADEKGKLQKAGARPTQLVLIYNGLPDVEERFRRRKETSPGLPVIGCVARFEPPKGLVYLVQAARLLAAQGRDFRLVLIGWGSQEKELRRLAGEDPRLRVEFTGAVDDPTPFYPGFDLFVLPSLQEALGMAAIEAMRAGLPVVASDTGGLREVVNDGETGLLVPPAQPAALAAAVGRLLADPLLRYRMGEAGRRRYLDLFHIRTMAESIAKIYDELLAKTPE